MRSTKCLLDNRTKFPNKRIILGSLKSSIMFGQAYFQENNDTDTDNIHTQQIKYTDDGDILVQGLCDLPKPLHTALLHTYHV